MVIVAKVSALVCGGDTVWLLVVVEMMQWLVVGNMSGEASGVDAGIVPVSGGANGGESNDDLRIMGR